MRAFFVERYGNMADLRAGKAPDPEVGADDVLVRIRAASLNPPDRMIRDGEMKTILPYRVPFILGNDPAGVVVKVGAAVVVDYKKQAFETVLHAYDLVLDSLGGETLKKSVLKPGGKVISVTGPPDAAFGKELRANPVIRPAMSALSFQTRRRARRRNVTYTFLFMKASGDQLRDLTPLIDAGKFRPVIDTVFPFESTREALEYVEAGHAKAGKVVVRMT